MVYQKGQKVNFTGFKTDDGLDDISDTGLKIGQVFTVLEFQLKQLFPIKALIEGQLSPENYHLFRLNEVTPQIDTLDLERFM